MGNRCKNYYSLFWVSRPNGAYPLLPLRAFGYLAGIVLVLVAVAIVVEFELTLTANRGSTNSKAWVDENNTISIQNAKKILSSYQAPLFRSLGYEVPPHQPDRSRLLVLGDSFIWGDGLTNINLTWWRQLQWELERRGFYNVDVLAAGTNGASTQDQLFWLKNTQLLKLANPSAIVVGYVTNDAEMRNAKGEDLVKQLPSSDNISQIEGSLVARVFPNLVFQLSSRIASKLHFTPNSQTGYPYGEWERRLLEGENFELYKLLIKDLAKTIHQIKIPFMFVTTPQVKEPNLIKGKYAPVQPLFSEADIEFHDLLPHIAECCTNNLGPLNYVANPANGHPGPQFTHFYATQVANILEKEHPVVLGTHSEGRQFKPSINDWMPAALNVLQRSAKTWTLDYPSNDSGLLFMPVRKKHISLNFERPVSIKSIKLSLTVPSDVRVWVTALNDEGNFDEKEYILVGSGAGTEVSIEFNQELVAKRITSLRIAKQTSSAGLKTLASLDSRNVSSSGGNAYYYPLPEMSGTADTNETPSRSDLLLLEDGRPLQFPHAIHEDIRKKGNGRYSHWDQGILFSSSDGSDPRKNGRSYTLSRETSEPIRLSIDFNSPAVKL